jgi:hypothetical protein
MTDVNGSVGINQSRRNGVSVWIFYHILFNVQGSKFKVLLVEFVLNLFFVAKLAKEDGFG